MSTNIVTNLEYIKTNAALHHAQNSLLRKALMQHSTQDVDAFVTTIATAVTAQIDCTSCANCCKTLHPDLQSHEIDALAQQLTITPQDFKNKYTNNPNATSENCHFKNKPCAFLTNDKCTVYSLRPLSCADFPNLHKPNFKYRYKRIMDFYNMCPIIYNTVQQLKTHYLMPQI
jgi:Fe-S-cluster containining protein